MKIQILFATAAIALLAGCSTTKTIVTEYDAEGRITKKTETSASVISEVVASTKGKTVIAWESGWAAYMSISTATQEDPTPTGKMFAGKTDKGFISALPDQQNWDGIASAINATMYELNVSTSGIEAKSVTKTETEKK